MASGREWPPRAAVACCRPAAPRGANACRPSRLRHDAARPQATRACRVRSMADGLVRLKTRADFLRVAAARIRAVRTGFILQAAGRTAAGEDEPAIRVGFTASRKVGNAVIRNRA